MWEKVFKSLMVAVKLVSLILTIPDTWSLSSLVYPMSDPVLAIVINMAAVLSIDLLTLAVWIKLDFDKQATMDQKLATVVILLVMYTGIVIIGVGNDLATVQSSITIDSFLTTWVFRLAMLVAILYSSQETILYTINKWSSKSDRNIDKHVLVKWLAKVQDARLAMQIHSIQVSEQLYKRQQTSILNKLRIQSDVAITKQAMEREHRQAIQKQEVDHEIVTKEIDKKRTVVKSSTRLSSQEYIDNIAKVMQKNPRISKNKLSKLVKKEHGYAKATVLKYYKLASKRAAELKKTEDAPVKKSSVTNGKPEHGDQLVLPGFQTILDSPVTS